MRIKRLTLTNAFQHKSLSLDFANMQAIIGPNGSGKSNLIEALGFCLGSDFTLPGKQESMVREGAESGRVDIIAESEGDELEISCHLGKSNRSLTCKAKGVKLKKSAEVLEYLQNRVLRTPFNIVNSTSVIRQGKLDAGLFDTAAKRTDAFMRMAGLSDIEKTRQALADAKAAITVPMLSGTIADVNMRIDEHTELISKLNKEKAGIPAFDKEQLDRCNLLVASADRIKAIDKELEDLDKSKSEFEKLVAEAERSVADCTAKLAAAEAEEESLSKLAAEARASVANADRVAKELVRYNSLKEKSDKHLADLEALVLSKPSEKFEGEDWRALQEIAAGMTSTIDSLKKTVEAFSSAVAVCPTCRRPCSSDEAASILSSAQAELAELVTIYTDTSKLIKSGSDSEAAWERARNTFNSKHASIEAALESVTEQLESFAEVPTPIDANDARNIVFVYDKAKIDAKTASTNLSEAKETLTTAKSELDKVNSSLTKLADEVGSLAVADNDAYAAATLFISNYNNATKRKSEIDGALSVAAKNLETEKANLAKLKKDAEQAKVYTEYAEHLEFARGALHRDNFPSGKVKAFIDRMLVGANAYLDVMQVGFSITYDRDDGFIAHFPREGKAMRADRLSGGEKVIFSLAFRFAVNDVYSDTGFLILDEPTVWLDDQRIDRVVSALSLVKTKLIPRVQLIIVTHDEKLASVADSVFALHK